LTVGDAPPVAGKIKFEVQQIYSRTKKLREDLNDVNKS
jgi:hypothetical protein